MPNRTQFMLSYELNMSTGSEEAEILVYGYIVTNKYGENNPDVTAKDFDKMLKDARTQGAKRLNIRINSGGGNIYQAVAMRTMLLSADFDEIKVRIDGLCASAATLIASVPGAHVSMGEGGSYMIHPPMNLMYGNAKDMEENAKYLRKKEDDFRAMYVKRSGKTDDQVKEWMDAETWFTAQEALDNGFIDEIITGEEAVACVTMETLDALRGMYKNVPEMAVMAALPDGKPADTNTSTGEPAVAAGEPTANTNNNEEDNTMPNINEATMEQLQAENPALHASIMQAGAAAERERIQEIDALTPPGEDYAEMAAKAKKDGTSAMDFHKQIVKAQKEKGNNFMQSRRKETAPAAAVAGGASEDATGDTDAELKAHAEEMAKLAKEVRAEVDGNMF